MFSLIFSWSASNTEDLLGYIQNILTDFTPFLTPIIAILIGLIVVGVIISFLRR